MPDESKTRFGVKLSEALDARSISQSNLANQLSVSRAYVNSLVNGVKSPSAETVDKLADSLGLEAQERVTLHRAAAADAGFRIELPDDF